MVGGRGLCICNELQDSVLLKALCAIRRIIVIQHDDKCIYKSDVFNLGMS
jgi:hypothetical protein